MPKSVLAKGPDTSFIIDYSHQLMFKTYGTYSRTTMPYNLPKRLPVIDLTTNNYIGVGLAFSYKWIGLGYAFNVAPVGDPALFGKTSSFDLYFSIYQPKHLVDLMYTDNRGFYIDNPKTIFKNWDANAPYPARPDLRTLMVGANYLYVFNGNRFSFKSTFTQTEQQKKSQGSFLVGGSFNYFSIDSDSSLIPKNYSRKDSLEITNEYVRGIFVGPSVRFGYAYNLVILKNLSILVSLTPGISLDYNEYNALDGKTYFTLRPNFQGNARLGFLYSKPSFFISANALDDFYLHSLKESDFRYNTLRLELCVGIRINAFSFMLSKKEKEARNNRPGKY